MRNLIVHVEGRNDELIVRILLSSVGIDERLFNIKVHNGKNNIKSYLQEIKKSANSNVNQVVVIDSDDCNIENIEKEAEIQLDYFSPEIKLYCAVPCIEAWLFADIENLMNTVKGEDKKSIIERLPLPEKIPYPKQVFSNLYSRGGHSDINNKIKDVLSNIDIRTAMSRSSSLRVFINGVLEIMNMETIKYEVMLKNSIGRDVFSTLLSELPKEKIVWKTLDGHKFTAFELAKEIEEGSDFGKQYISDILRIVRDMVARKAKN